MEMKATMGSIDSLSHLSQCSSPRMGSALSEDQFSVRSDEGRVKFMCSYGGKIMPRPHDCQLRYVGGETRILVVSRSISLADLMARLTRLSGKSVLLKFQLPDEDLDSLVSVLCEEDLENMMEEYDRIETRDASVRLRLFLFPVKSDGASVDLQEFDGRNAEQRFVDAVNGFRRQAQSMPAGSTGGLPDFLFGLDVFDRHNGGQTAGPITRASSQRLPAAISKSSYAVSTDQFVPKDHLSPSLSLPSTIPPMLGRSDVAASGKQPAPSGLLYCTVSLSKSPISLVLDPASPQNVEMINQLSSLIPIPSDQSAVAQTRFDPKLHPLLHQTKTSTVIQRSANEELCLLYGPLDHVDPPDDVEDKLQISGAVSSSDHASVLMNSTSSLADFLPQIASNAQIPSVSMPASHSLSLLGSTEDKYFPTNNLQSHAVGDQDSKPMAMDATPDSSSCLRLQTPDAMGLSLLTEELSDWKIQEKIERLSESRTVRPVASQYGKANGKASPEHNFQHELIKLDQDTEIPTAAKNLQHHHDNLIIQPAFASPPRAAGSNSQFPPPTMPRVASSPLPLKSYDILPKFAKPQGQGQGQGQHILGAVPPSDGQLLLRHLTPAADLQQQPFLLPRIKVGQPNTVPAATRESSTTPHPAASRIHPSPSRFHEKGAPSGRLPGAGQEWVESEGIKRNQLIKPSTKPMYQDDDHHLHVDDPTSRHQLLMYDTVPASQLLYTDQYQHLPSDMAAQFIPFHHDHQELAMGHRLDDQQQLEYSHDPVLSGIIMQPAVVR